MTWADWGIRLIRVDNPHTKSFNFWEWVIAEVQAVYPDMIFLARHLLSQK
jgi:starch synthase (maltosyl-transferring)